MPRFGGHGDHAVHGIEGVMARSGRASSVSWPKAQERTHTPHPMQRSDRRKAKRLPAGPSSMWIALTGQTFSHLPHPRQSFPGAGDEVGNGWSGRWRNRLIASSASQQHPQQLQMKFTPSRAFFAKTGRGLCPCATASRSRHSAASTCRAWPYLMSERAEVLKVYADSIGASPPPARDAAFLWRQ